ncbi:MAG: glycosyltransferase family 2 protein, partial [Micropepsaceae bacterium]
MSRPDTLVLIPARNEASRIGRVIESIRLYEPNADVLVVEDGSTDGTVAVVRSTFARIVSLPVGLGYGGALRVGYQYAVSKKYLYVVTLDADGQHDPSDLPRLLAVLKSGKADFVVGSRFVGRAHYKVPFARRLGMLLFSAIASTIAGRPISDTTSGFVGVGPQALPIVMRQCANDFPNAELICV